MATAQLTTVVNRDQDDILTEPIWDDQLRDNINQLIGLRSGNILVNGEFEVWQRGAGPFTTHNAYTSDCWYMEVGSSSTITQETSVVDSAGSALKLVGVAPGNTVVQKIENFATYRGKTLSLSMRIRQSVAAGLRISLSDGISSGTGLTAATTGSYITHTLTYTVNAAATRLYVIVETQASGTFYLDNAMLVFGPAATQCVPEDPQVRLARCQRYYEVHGGIATAFPNANGIATAGGQGARGSYTWAVPKGGIPTVTKLGTWAVANCGQPTVVGASPNGYTIEILSTAAGGFASNPNSGDDLIVGEWSF